MSPSYLTAQNSVRPLQCVESEGRRSVANVNAGSSILSSRTGFNSHIANPIKLISYWILLFLEHACQVMIRILHQVCGLRA